MDNSNRYFASLERISSSAKFSNPNVFHQDVRTGHSGYFASPPRSWDSSPFPPTAVTQTWEDIEGDEDVSLDAFDKELLATERERPLKRQWQASQGISRISLPSTASTTPSYSDSREYRDELYQIPFRDPLPSLPSAGPPSSPTANRTNVALAEPSTPRWRASRPKQPAKAPAFEISHEPPIVQGIRLVSTSSLRDQFRSLFPFPAFNAVQSKCFPIAFNSDDNVVLSAPTGSGKTVVMELAICRLMTFHTHQQFKVVYQAPTKSLCAERYRDWQARFGTLDLQCAELTGDTDYSQLRGIQNAAIIITTPEKWDSVTRKWKDHAKLMQLVKLFLIDEVHVLKDSRGATLEAVVSRMKSVGSSVRFIALSATVPNSEDIATWLGKSTVAQHLPAHREVFGEEYRPVKLQKFVYGYDIKQNDFVFDNVLTDKLPDIIARHSNRKPIMIFCFTRKSAIKTSKALAGLWTATNAADRLWPAPKRHIQVMDPELRRESSPAFTDIIPSNKFSPETTSASVAFHHAGLDLADRRAVEEGFLDGNIKIICSTSTLAVGVNLPCYLVIVKGTVSWAENGLQEYADLEMMQMLGRAGRPQFESSACAVILTRDKKIQRYQSMVWGNELLESSLHLNLVDHLNAEIGLGTVFDIPSARRWLGSTFLFVRLRRNPNHYKLNQNDNARRQDENELLEQICDKGLRLLESIDLISGEGKLKCTEFGDAMARYCVKFETMKIILSLPPKAKISEILSVLAQADEFRDIHMKASEKTLFKEMNKDVGIKFPIKVDVALSAHKISLLIQAELGGVEFPATDLYKKFKQQYQQDKGMVFQHVNRLIRCIIDCQLYLQDSVSARHALELGRSLAARVWDTSPLQLKQLEQIGNIAVRKLAGAGINSMEILENTEAHRIDTILQKNPPFGMRLLSKLVDFPKLRVSVKQIGKESRQDVHVEVRLSAVIGFLNETAPLFFHKKPVYVCFMAETSDGIIVDFRRMHAKHIHAEDEIFIQAKISKPTAYIACHVMCDEIAGTSQKAEIRLDHIPTSLFSSINTSRQDGKRAPKVNKSSGNEHFKTASQVWEGVDDFDDGSLDDGDLLAAEAHKGVEVIDIDNLFEEEGNPTISNRPRTRSSDDNRISKKRRHEGTSDEPVRLENGKWACNHHCKKEGKECKHTCCNEGLDRPRKPPQKRLNQDFKEGSVTTSINSRNDKKQKNSHQVAHSASEERTHRRQKSGAQEKGEQERLHRAIGVSDTPTSHLKDKLGSKQHGKNPPPRRSFSENPSGPSGLYRAEYLDEFEFDDLPMLEDLFGDRYNTNFEQSSNGDYEVQPDIIGEGLGIEENDLFSLEAGMVGIEDSMTPASGNNDFNFGFENDNVDVLGYDHLSSETLDNSSSPKPQHSIAPNFFDSEEDMGFFDAPLMHVQLRSLQKQPLYRNDKAPLLGCAVDLMPVEQGLFVTGESSSPSEPVPPGVELAQKQTLPSTGLVEDEQALTTQFAKKTEFGVEAPNVKEPLRLPLQDVTNVQDGFKAVSNNAEEEGGSTEERGMKKEGESYEERQKRLWTGIDLAIYEEFKDIVELVD